MTLNELLQILCAFIGSLAFGILFNVRKWRLIFAGIGGLLSWALFIVLSEFIQNEPINY